MKYSALVLAGSRGQDCPVAALGNVSHKALVPVNGIPMIERVISCLSAAENIDKVAIVIENPEILYQLPGLKALFENGFLSAIVADKTPSLSALKGFEVLGAGNDAPVFVTTADNCLLTPDMVAFFLRSLPTTADAVAGVALTDMVMQAYPGGKRTRIKFRDGDRGGCNLFAFRTPAAMGIIRFWRAVEENRKKPSVMIRQLGILTVLRYATRSLTLAQALRALERRTGTKLAAVEMPYPEAAIDVDKPEDLDLASKILTEREKK